MTSQPPPLPARLAGQLALVTGAGGGIGLAVCERLAREGASIIAVDRTRPEAERAADLVSRHGRDVWSLEVDQRESASVLSLPLALKQAGSAIPTIVVCCAGVQTFQDALSLRADEWDLVFDVNARGTFLVLQTLGREMSERHTGAIVTIASIQARLGSPHYAHYSASKAAVLSLTRSFALALAQHRIRVNAVAPGIIDTDMWDAADREIATLTGQEAGEPRSRRVAVNPLGRAGTPQDVAAAVAFLVSSDADYVTGECLHVCGGDVML